MPIVNTDTGEILTATLLTSDEADRLAGCEAVIEAGLMGFVEVGEALAGIRDARLYRQEHASFEDYVRERWGLSRRTAYRMVDSAKIVAALCPMGHVEAPANERQVRELAPLRDDPERLAAAWQQANDTAEAEGRSVTAADVRSHQQPLSPPTPCWSSHPPKQCG